MLAVPLIRISGCVFRGFICIMYEEESDDDDDLSIPVVVAAAAAAAVVEALLGRMLDESGFVAMFTDAMLVVLCFVF